MAKLKNYPVTICGAGALGANIAENLARSGFDKLTVIDRDRIERSAIFPLSLTTVLMLSI